MNLLILMDLLLQLLLNFAGVMLCLAHNFARMLLNLLLVLQDVLLRLLLNRAGVSLCLCGDGCGLLSSLLCFLLCLLSSQKCIVAGLLCLLSSLLHCICRLLCHFTDSLLNCLYRLSCLPLDITHVLVGNVLDALRLLAGALGLQASTRDNSGSFCHDLRVNLLHENVLLQVLLDSSVLHLGLVSFETKGGRQSPASAFPFRSV